jgi:tRNA (mo5U34)-methyltransferase
MDTDALRAEIARLGPWHHALELAPGLWTAEQGPAPALPAEQGTVSTVWPEHTLRTLAAQLWPDGLQGRSFLDCACNAGGYLFAARALGAGPGFGFDIRPHWIDQARFLARHLPSEGIDFAVADLADLPAMDLPRFDVTWFSGLFYHLPDPVAGLRAAADRTEELIVLSTDVKPAPGDGLILNREGTSELMSGVHGLAWLPSNDRVVAKILAWCGFPHTRLRFDRPREDRRRIQILAAREERAFEHYDKLAPPRPPQERRGLLQRLLGRSG